MKNFGENGAWAYPGLPNFIGKSKGVKRIFTLKFTHEQIKVASESTLKCNFYSASAYAKRCISYRKSVRLSVCLSIGNTLAQCQNDSRYHHGVFTVG